MSIPTSVVRGKSLAIEMSQRAAEVVKWRGERSVRIIVVLEKGSFAVSSSRRRARDGRTAEEESRRTC